MKKLGEIHFEQVDMTDSIVLGWDCTARAFRIRLDVSLLAEHPKYDTPPRQHRSCFVSGELVFDKLTAVSGLHSMDEVSPTTDADGSIDYDTLHGLWKVEGGFCVEGEFGEVRLSSDPPILRISSLDEIFHCVIND
ncbi:hypothetical protein [Marinicella meishanensis]|uniref:hypothetical protein n=1 Tax=Marinicella meishanensis TaxID=2873263 RepID=UPI001CBB2720|nr:hypothetical protein [Marinicella sp. NBU2979]